MLTIRMQRIGRKKFPTYRLVVAEKARDTQGDSLDIVGSYNPHDKIKGFQPNIDRIKHWLSKGAVASETVHNLLINNKIIEGKKAKSITLTKKRQLKMTEKQKAKADADASADAKAMADKAAAEAEAKIAEEVVVEEVKEETPAEEVKVEEAKEEVKAEEAPAQEIVAEATPVVEETIPEVEEVK